MSQVIEATGLVKKYGDVVALDGLDLSVEEGTILGLLGPNGAGKTTAAGADVLTQPGEVRKRIGLSGQYAAVDENLTGFENLDMIGRLYHLPRETARSRARELLEQFDLSAAADRPVKTYSGGMRRRLDLAGALVARSPVLFLDEPTTGLDPRSRVDLWAIIKDLVSEGTTLLLTTQYLEEADVLADEILVIDHGHAIARGTAAELKADFGGDRIEVEVADDTQVARAVEVLSRFAEGEIQHDERSPRLIVPITGGAQVLTDALRALDNDHVALSDVQLRRPTLDDVFLAITGRHADEPVMEEVET